MDNESDPMASLDPLEMGLWDYVLIVFLVGFLHGQKKIMTDVHETSEVDHG